MSSRILTRSVGRRMVCLARRTWTSVAIRCCVEAKNQGPWLQGKKGQLSAEQMRFFFMVPG